MSSELLVDLGIHDDPARPFSVAVPIWGAYRLTPRKVARNSAASRSP
jgi:hypothetical protein